ncbi:hypothetical protein MKW94_017302 [Papaver nudicaule]|uniref:Uncharacterized protein n=1 Tax=Papaver nudicaule TaxID=74823 RepID=A0AA41S119_PAPNU|nr:hypothetical protein [Papaver nudicaule]
MASDEKIKTGEPSNKQVMKTRERSSSSLAGSSGDSRKENPTKGTYRRSSSMSLPTEFSDAAMELAIKRALTYEREDILKPASITTLKGKTVQDQNSSSDEDSRDELQPMTPDMRTNFSPSAFSSCQHDTRGIMKNKEMKCSSSKGLSKKYQPKLFEDVVVGHEIVIKALSSAVRKETITPLYLFHGPSGTGKTSVARIFSMALNCEATSCTKPCWSCRCCSRSLYIMDLCSGSRTPGFRRIITLLHSTTFIKTVSGCMGRCQKFCFSNLKDMDINLKLARIVALEKIEIERDSMKLVISKADGSMREAENILDQLILLGSKITTSMVQQITARFTRELVMSGVQPQTLILQLSSLITVILSGASEAVTSSSATSSKDRRLLRNGSQLTNYQSQRLSYALKILVETEKQLSSSNDQTTWVLEALLQIASEQAPNRNSTDIVSARDVFRPSDDNYATENNDQSKITIDDQQTGTESLCETDKCSGTTIRKETDFTQLGNMEDVWQSMLGKVQDRYVKKLLCQQVKLASLTICSVNAIVHLIFVKSEDKLAAQMSEGTISEALRNAFGRPVTVNMSLEPPQLKIIQENSASTANSQVDCGHSRQWKQPPHLLISESPSSMNARAVVVGRNKSQQSSYTLENNFRRTKKARIARPQQVLPFSGVLTQRKGDASMDHGNDQSVGEESPKVATDFLKATKTKPPLASVQNGDASVEQYSQDLLFENANMEREKMERRNSKMNKDQQLQQKGRTKAFSRSWSCNEIFCRETKVRSSTT